MKMMTWHSAAEILAASPSRVVVMLYDEAISALRTAVMAIAAEDIETRCNAVTKATEVVGHLYMTLDTDLGGEVAHNLGAIYGHIISRLTRVNLYNDVAVAEEAIRLLEPLRDSWDELDSSLTEEDMDFFHAAVAQKLQAEQAAA